MLDIDQLNHGPIYPAFIARLEYPDKTMWELTLDGHSKEFPSYDEAYDTARNLLEYPAARAQWRSLK